MKEQLISSETAKLAKEKGFDKVLYITNISYFYYDDFLSTGSNSLVTYRYKERPNIYLAPTQSLLQKWLREIHGIEVWVTPLFDKVYKVNWFYTTLFQKSNTFTKYEEALEVGLVDALNLIPNVI